MAIVRRSDVSPGLRDYSLIVCMILYPLDVLMMYIDIASRSVLYMTSSLMDQSKRIDSAVQIATIIFVCMNKRGI